ncbi:MAG: hypothetical protein GX444_06155 [Myxococcales bacterium]|nr:hypothetical protein [Myxococcales bacterium]
MKSRLLYAVAALLLAALLLAATAGYTPVEDFLTADADWVMEISRPVGLLWRLQSAGWLDFLSTAPEFQASSAETTRLLADLHKPAARAALDFLVSAAYLLRATPPANGGEENPQDRILLDLGFAGRVLGRFADFAGLARDFGKAGVSLQWRDKWLVIVLPSPVGSPAATATADPEKARLLREYLRRDRADLAGDGDGRLYLLNRRLFNQPVSPAGFDPRLLLEDGAVERAFARATLAEDGLHLTLTLAPFAGKSVSPLLATAPGAFATRPLADDQTLAYLGLRVDRPSRLSPLLLRIVDAGEEMKSLQKKMALLMFNTFFEYSGPEMAVALPASETTPGSPVFVFQMANQNKLVDMLAAMSKSAETQTKLLGLPLGPNGESVAQLLTRAAGDVDPSPWLAKLPAEDRAPAAELLEKIRRGELDPQKLLQDSQRLYFYKMSLYWRLAGDFLILGPTPEAAEYYRQCLLAGAVPPDLGERAAPPAADRAALASIDAGAWLTKVNPRAGELLGDLDSRIGRLVIDARQENDRLTVSGWLPFRSPATAGHDSGAWWLLLFRTIRVLLLASVALGLIACVGRAALKKN